MWLAYTLTEQDEMLIDHIQTKTSVLADSIIRNWEKATVWASITQKLSDLIDEQEKDTRMRYLLVRISDNYYASLHKRSITLNPTVEYGFDWCGLFSDYSDTDWFDNEITKRMWDDLSIWMWCRSLDEKHFIYSPNIDAPADCWFASRKESGTYWTNKVCINDIQERNGNSIRLLWTTVAYAWYTDVTYDYFYAGNYIKVHEQCEVDEAIRKETDEVVVNCFWWDNYPLIPVNELWLSDEYD